MKDAMEVLQELGIEATLRQVSRERRSIIPKVSIRKHKTSKPRISFNKNALKMILGHENDLNVVFALSRCRTSLYVVICKPTEHNSVLLKANKTNAYHVAAGDISLKLGVTENIFFTGELVPINHNVYEVKLQKYCKQ